MRTTFFEQHFGTCLQDEHENLEARLLVFAAPSLNAVNFRFVEKSLDR